VTDLPDFLLARIAEDEALATAVNPDPVIRTSDSAVVAFLDAWHADRVLAECAAKRRLVELAKAADAKDKSIPREDVKQSTMILVGTIDGLVLAMMCAALPYADHPDWREEWKP